MTETLEGGCFCKAVRYRLTGAPMFVNCCHCLNCKNQTGSAFVINAFYETDRIELMSGDLDSVTVETGTGRPNDIYSCTKCHVAVWSDYGQRPGVRLVRVGTLDDPTALKPDAHIFVRSKLSWVTLPEDAPTFETFYKTKETWPAESIERMRAAMNKDD